MDKPTLPPVLAGDERFALLCDMLWELYGSLDTTKILVYLVDIAPEVVLPHLAEQFSLADEVVWAAARTPEAKRTLLKRSIDLHRLKGTPWALRQVLQTVGISADIIERAAVKSAYADYAPLLLDGTWRVNGQHKIRPLDIYAGLPALEHWAQFIVRTNLADVTDAEVLPLLRQIVHEWKPARTRPVFMFWLSFLLDVFISVSSSTLMDKAISLRYPWCGRVIGSTPDVVWRLGRDGEPLRLPQPFGSFRVGQLVGAVSNWKLKPCRVLSDAAMQSHASAEVYGQPQLSQPDRRLNGAWKVGGRKLDASSNASISASSETALPIAVDVMHHETVRLDYPATPFRLGSHVRLSPWRRLDGRWSIGAMSRSRPFGFALRRDISVLAESEASIQIDASAYAWPERLTRPAATKLTDTWRRLDGQWSLGAENRLGRFALDGRRLRARKLFTSPRIGGFSLAQEIPGAVYEAAPVRRLQLNGGWRLGAPAAPDFTLTVIKEVAHG